MTRLRVRIESLICTGSTRFEEIACVCSLLKSQRRRLFGRLRARADASHAYVPGSVPAPATRRQVTSALVEQLYVDYSADHPGVVVNRRPSDVALQHWLGLLSKWRAWLGACHRSGSGIDGPSVMSQAKPTYGAQLIIVRARVGGKILVQVPMEEGAVQVFVVSLVHDSTEAERLSGEPTRPPSMGKAHLNWFSISSFALFSQFRILSPIACGNTGS